MLTSSARRTSRARRSGAGPDASALGAMWSVPDPRHRLRLSGGEARRDQLGAVGVREQRVAQSSAYPRDAVAPAAGHVVDRFQDPVGDGAEQLLFVGEMPVQRAGGDVELAGQPTEP